MKFGGSCAYTGTVLDIDWQVDHIEAVRRNWFSNDALCRENHNFENMVPTQRIINHYKHSYDLELFRNLLLTLHFRLKKTPKNPRTEKGLKRKEYLYKVASYFEITEDKQWDGLFYFEKLKQQYNETISKSIEN